jgi:ABC-2 type transport system ATP-binding protein
LNPVLNSNETLLYAQVVDRKRNIVVGNVVTPIPVKLDGVPRTVTRPLEDVAASVPVDGSYELQIVPATSVYGPQRAAGEITMSAIDVSIPVVSGYSAGP